MALSAQDAAVPQAQQMAQQAPGQAQTPPPANSAPSAAPPAPQAERTPQISAARSGVPDAVVEAASGVVGGIIALLATYPLKSIYSYQAQDSKTLSVLQVLQRYKLSGLFIGIEPNIFETALTSGTYFYLYRKLKDLATQNGRRELGLLASLLVPALAGVGNQLITMPASVVATRMQAMKKARVDQRLAASKAGGASSSSAPAAGPVTVTSVTRTILREQGPGGFWAGLLPSLVLISNPTIQYALYEQLLRALRAWKRRRLLAEWQRQQQDAAAAAAAAKEAQQQQQQQQQQAAAAGLANGAAVNGKHPHAPPPLQAPPPPPPHLDIRFAAWETFLVSALAKIGATVSTYGLIVIKTRMQAQGKETPPELRYRNALDAFVRILRSEGVGGFTKGLGAKVVQTALNAALMLMLKEQVYLATRRVLTTPGLLGKAQHALTGAL